MNVSHGPGLRTQKYKNLLRYTDQHDPARDELARKVVQADVILPIQFGSRSRAILHGMGEFKMLVALVEETINDYLSVKPHKRADQSNAADWLMGAEPGRFGFEYVCEIIGLDMVAVQDNLRRMRGRVVEERRALRRASSLVPVADLAAAAGSN